MEVTIIDDDNHDTNKYNNHGAGGSGGRSRDR